MSFLSEKDVAHLHVRAKEIRKTIVEMLAHAQSGHTAGPLGLADIFAALYFHVLRHDPRNPDWEERDRLILSNGHTVPVRYAAMAHSGYFPVEEVQTFRALHTRLQGHPERTRLPGLETTSGPLGEGLGQAVGIALGARMDGKAFHTYCVASDGEQQCGAVWESAMLAGREKLSNLTLILDRNHIQISGRTEDVLPLEPLAEKYESFGWHVIIVDGNDVEMFCEAVAQAHTEKEKPTVLIAHTVAGKGVASIEDMYEWHGYPPSAALAKQWIEEIDSTNNTA